MNIKAIIIMLSITAISYYILPVLAVAILERLSTKQLDAIWKYMHRFRARTNPTPLKPPDNLNQKRKGYCQRCNYKSPCEAIRQKGVPYDRENLN